MAATRSRRRAPRSWSTLAALIILAAVALMIWSWTADRRTSTPPPGAEQHFALAQTLIEDAAGEVLPGLAQPAREVDASEWPLPGAGPGAMIRCRVAAYGGPLSWWQVQRRMAEAVLPAGGRVLWAERLPSSRRARDLQEPDEQRDLLRLDLGLPGRPTHTLVLYRQATPPPEILWGQDPGAGAWKQLHSRAAGPVVALVIDDWGNRQDATTGGLLGLEVPLTLAVLPGLPYSRRFALEGSDLVLPSTAEGADASRLEAAAAGRFAAGCPVHLAVGPDPGRLPPRRREIILHLPMQPQGYPDVDPGPRALLIGMSAEQIGLMLDECLLSMPGVRGVSNHMGSAATADEPTMRALMTELAARDLLFLDSLTTAHSVAYRTARSLGLPAARNRIFLDHDHQDRGNIRERLQTLVRSARATGFAIGIGHLHPATLQVLSEEVPRLKADGVLFVTLSELLALQAWRDEAGG